MDFAQTFRHGHQTTLHLAVFYKKIRIFPGFFPDFPDFTLLCKIFSNENAIKPKNLTFMAIIMDFAQTFRHGHHQPNNAKYLQKER